MARGIAAPGSGAAPDFTNVHSLAGLFSFRHTLDLLRLLSSIVPWLESHVAATLEDYGLKGVRKPRCGLESLEPHIRNN